MAAPRPVAHAALVALAREVETCTACPRLVAFREAVAIKKRAAYRDWTYWGRPVAGFGDAAAKLVVLGLAPGAHGANRTGRVFTGDRSGDFLYAALHRAGLASQPTSERRDDGLVLTGVWITLAARCVPPDNHPLPVEIRRCGTRWLDRELDVLEPRVVLALGAIAWNAYLDHLVRRGLTMPRPRPRFAHGAVAALPGGAAAQLVGSYHVSQQNTQTGRLTSRMFDEVLRKAATMAGSRTTARERPGAPTPKGRDHGDSSSGAGR